jgi:oligoribonuclease (3'-5' exoribonuclease)
MVDWTKKLVFHFRSIDVRVELYFHYFTCLGHVVVDYYTETQNSTRHDLACVWLRTESKEAPRKEKNHRAMDDIRESIKELQYYKESIFKSRRSK